MEVMREVWEMAAKGAVAVLVCREQIPCNPCEEACRRGAIVVGEDICTPPRYDPSRCDGCGRCVAICPGMAVVLLDRSPGGGRARVTLPYEMRDAVEAGGEAWALDAEGVPLGKGRIVRTAKASRKDAAMLVTLEVPEEWSLKVKGLRVRVMSLEAPQEAEMPSRDEGRTVCRCEEISCAEAQAYAAMGFRSLGALRRYSRIGLGYCQGRFCQTMLAGELQEATSRTPEEVGTFRVRPPVRPVKLSRLGGEDG
ncbi:MAG: 4Fe-4S binding protein [Actinomycetota bacterium]